MPRTSLILPASLQQRLHTEAKGHDVKIAVLIRELLDKALEAREKKRIEKMYTALWKVKGICEDPEMHDASSTIDDVLYGEHGAWKGSDE